MKKITIALMFFFGFLMSGFAQSDSLKMQKSSKMSHQSTGMNKDGSPDMRMKANKQAKMQADAQKASMAADKNTDKSVGKDAQGRTIYQGARGGKYVINKQGNKDYITKDK